MVLLEIMNNEYNVFIYRKKKVHEEQEEMISSVPKTLSGDEDDTMVGVVCTAPTDKSDAVSAHEGNENQLDSIALSNISETN